MARRQRLFFSAKGDELMIRKESYLQKYIRRNGLTVLDYKTHEEILRLSSPMWRERKTHKVFGSGRPDLLSLKDETLYIIETKLGKAEPQHIGQLMAYLNEFQFWVNGGKEIAGTIRKTVKGILVAESYYKEKALIKGRGKKQILDWSVFWAMYSMRSQIMLVKWAQSADEITFRDVTREYEEQFTRFLTGANK